ncbi:hypothetical protein BC833DRAFT_620506 [Globomyces pollinis-pini]|nr:hypothetical protein BC833DRAFT_620506 [Globomyces pollinis-pini]
MPTYITAQWISNECSQAPDVMYGWTLTDPNASKPPKNDVWPAGYQTQASRIPFSKRCVLSLKVPLSKECCSVAIDLNRAKGFTSSATVKVPVGSPVLEYAPKTANGATYCSVISDNSNLTSVFGFEQAYYNGNGKCIGPENVICQSNGILQLYPLKDCKGEPVSIPLSANSNVPITTLAAIGSTIQIQEAKTTFSWFMNADLTNLYMPTGKYAFESIFFIFYLLGLLLILYSLYQRVKKFFGNKSFYTTGMVLTQLMWLAHLLIKFLTNLTGYSRLADFFSFLFFELASLSTVLISLKFMCNMYRYSVAVQVCMYGFTIILHGVTNWNHYLRFTYIPYSSDVNAYLRIANPFWIYLMFVVDLLPPLCVIYRLGRNLPSLPVMLQTVWRADVYFCGLLFLAILNFGIYLFQIWIRNSSELLGDDRVWVCVLSVESFTFALHSFIVVNLVDRMSLIIKKGPLESSTNDTSKKQTH